jgi:hypothetical protein
MNKFDKCLQDIEWQDTKKTEPFTMKNLMEAKALLEALAPKQAPANVGMISFGAGLKIMKNDMMPSNTVMVSKDLFDMLFDCAEQAQKNPDA